MITYYVPGTKSHNAMYTISLPSQQPSKVGNVSVCKGKSGSGKSRVESHTASHAQRVEARCLTAEATVSCYGIMSRDCGSDSNAPYKDTS